MTPNHLPQLCPARSSALFLARAAGVAAEALERRVLMSVSPTNDPRASSQWSLLTTNVDDAWTVSRGSATVIAAEIDTGIDYTHQDLYENIWINQAEIPASVHSRIHDTDHDGRVSFYDLNDPANAGVVTDNNRNGYIDAGDLLRPVNQGGWEDGINGKNNPNDVYTDDIVGWDFAQNDNDPFDGGYANVGHGTHVAGIMGAIGNNGVGVSGVSQKLSIAGIRIFNDQGKAATYDKLAEAIRYGADIGAKISNSSWGGSYGYNNDVVYQAIAYAGTKGQTFLAAAGNSGGNLDAWANFYPAEYDLNNIVVVGATSLSGSTPYWTNYGSTKVDVFAPGNAIMSTLPGNRYGLLSGTSMATPFVTGTAALMMAVNPTLTPAQIKERLIDGSDQSMALNNRSVSDGEVNVANAVMDREGYELGTLLPANSFLSLEAKKKAKLGLMNVVEETSTASVGFVSPFSKSPTIKYDAKDLLA